ncbi:MAG: alpha-E domain-containing protein [Hyphomicrobium sp.]
MRSSIPPPEALLDLLEDGLGWLAAFNGLFHENMTRNKGWSFLDMGRRIERAGSMSEAILWLFTRPLPREEEAGRLFYLLEVADSFITYRSRYRLDPMLALVLDLLLLDETNPRSLAYQLAIISQHLGSLPQAQAAAGLDGRAPSHSHHVDIDPSPRRRGAGQGRHTFRPAGRAAQAAAAAAAAHHCHREALLQSSGGAAAPRAHAAGAETMIYDVSHRTVYRYTTPVVQSQHVVHMTPRVVERQRVRGHVLVIEPAPTIRTERIDYFGNRVVMFDIEQEHKELIVHAKTASRWQGAERS